MSYPPPYDPQQPPQQYWQQPPGPPQQPYQYGPPPVRKRKKLPFILGGIGAVLLLCVGGTVIAAVSSDSAQESFAKGYAEAQASHEAERAASAPAETTAPTQTPTRAVAEPTEKVATTTNAAPAKIKVPDGVGMDYQSAQDLWRAAGLHVAPAEDATGANRLPVIDSNWVVVAQDLKPGSSVAAGSFITATVKKYSDD